uniref:DUF7477 domain-containing protein n=1 Tax=Arundo donax TaxID=35708 RepID=A0A0A9ED38_ARUDO
MQAVELDFLYPSEGIHRRWENGYRITSTAATGDQAAFILSIPKRKLIDEMQETLGMSAFPSNHVKEKWAKNLYTAAMAGRCHEGCSALHSKLGERIFEQVDIRKNQRFFSGCSLLLSMCR